MKPCAVVPLTCAQMLESPSSVEVICCARKPRVACDGVRGGGGGKRHQSPPFFPVGQRLERAAVARHFLPPPHPREPPGHRLARRAPPLTRATIARLFCSRHAR